MTQTLSLGPLSLLAEQHGPLLAITIHAPSDTAPVGRMTLTVAEWTSLVALVDCMGAAERRIAELAKERDSIKRHYDAAAPEHNLLALLDMYEERERAAIAGRDSLRQQVRELTEENERQMARMDEERAAIADGIIVSHGQWNAMVTARNTAREMVERQALHITHLVMQLRGKDWHEEVVALRSDLSAALVSVDAMAERLKVITPVYECAVGWRNALGSDAPTRHDAYCKLMSAIDAALAHTASEQGKESK